MSLFEFVTVMVSMILALCLGHVLRSTSLLAKTEKSVAPYLPYTIWTVVLLLSVINHWWSLWDLRDIEWTYASFLYILMAPILISFAAGFLMPEDTDAKVISLKSHYLRVRRLFFATMTGYGIFMLFDGPLLSGQSLSSGVSIFSLILLMDTVIPMFTPNQRINAACGALSIALVVSVMVTRYLAA
ncbi:hypothetical protein R0137_09800 [Congregibacter brevis]|uniref:EamA domain-containing protein n=1 Tax=Congregibacter brevis TaxID=3081201 RepID=A0ABZ0I7Q1_9GAMM|nr:hypothetical protein R0137_09800 [Congregibacter sp. IMCC45268]